MLLIICLLPNDHTKYCQPFHVESGDFLLPLKPQNDDMNLEPELL